MIGFQFDYDVVSPDLEISDPNPDIHYLFNTFNQAFFGFKLSAVSVEWSDTLRSAAGVCASYTQIGLCIISLSRPLLSLRPRKDLVETLLHEMIHAYLFVTDNDRDRDGHGPKFKALMGRINVLTGANITVYHNFHDEVNYYANNWYRCNGPCRNEKPLFGYRKGKKERGPCNKDAWYIKHKEKCKGVFLKVPNGPTKENIQKQVDNQTKLKILNGKVLLIKESEGEILSGSKAMKNTKKVVSDISSNKSSINSDISESFDNVQSVSDCSTYSKSNIYTINGSISYKTAIPFKGKGVILSETGTSKSNNEVMSNMSSNILGIPSNVTELFSNTHSILEPVINNIRTTNGPMSLKKVIPKDHFKGKGHTIGGTSNRKSIKSSIKNFPKSEVEALKTDAMVCSNSANNFINSLVKGNYTKVESLFPDSILAPKDTIFNDSKYDNAYTSSQYNSQSNNNKLGDDLISNYSENMFPFRSQLNNDTTEKGLSTLNTELREEDIVMEDDVERAIKLSLKCPEFDEVKDLELAIQKSLQEGKRNNPDEYVQCPSCYIYVLMTEINDHLNSCLT